METYKSESKYEKYCGVVFTFGKLKKSALSLWVDLHRWVLIPTIILNRDLLPIYNSETGCANITHTVSLQCLCFKVDVDITVTKKHPNYEQ